MSFGNADNWEASAQGATFSRDSAERTLSVIVFSSAPIGAERKSLNSAQTKKVARAGVMGTPITRCSREKARARRVSKANHKCWQRAPLGSESTYLQGRVVEPNAATERRPEFG
jgi:hypothetical protein